MLPHGEYWEAYRIRSMNSEKRAMDVMRLVLRVYSINTNRLQGAART